MGHSKDSIQRCMQKLGKKDIRQNQAFFVQTDDSAQIEECIYRIDL